MNVALLLVWIVVSCPTEASDYLPRPLFGFLRPGDISCPSVTIVNDLTIEDMETFTAVVLPTDLPPGLGVQLAPHSTAVVEIIDDDGKLKFYIQDHIS